MSATNYLPTSSIVDTAAVTDEPYLKDSDTGTFADFLTGAYCVFDLGAAYPIDVVAAHADVSADALIFEGGNSISADDATLGTVYGSGSRNGVSTGDLTPYRYVKVSSPTGPNIVYELFAESPNTGGGSGSGGCMMSAMLAGGFFDD